MKAFQSVEALSEDVQKHLHQIRKIIQTQAYKQGKGSVQFPLAQGVLFDLIRRIVAFRAEENRKKVSGK